MKLNWLLSRQTCNLNSLKSAIEFAESYGMEMQVDLIHYSLPYFSEGPDRMLQFRAEDAPIIDELVGELIRVKMHDPQSLTLSIEGLRSIPDWLLKGPHMSVPCVAYEMLWVGADGSVQLCYVKFKIGNLHEKRLRDMIKSREHIRACRDAFLLVLHSLNNYV
jgi:cyclic pyranopterin phosphate synthase